MTDERIEQAIEKVKAGDLDAFREVVDDTLVVLRSYIGFFIRDSQQMDDILQETYLQIFRQIRQYKAGTSFLHWAKAIVRFKALGYLRSRQRKQDAHQRYVAEISAQISELAAGDESAVPLESRLKALVACLDSLAEKARRLVQLRYFHGTSVDDIAAALNLKPSAVGMALLRVRTSLAECVEKSL